MLLQYLFLRNRVAAGIEIQPHILARKGSQIEELPFDD